MPRASTSLRTAVLAAAVFALVPAGLAGRVGLVNGENLTSTIAFAGEVDTYTFSATAGDAIMLAIGEVGADTAFVPWIRLTGPTAQNLGSQSGTLAAQIEASAPQTGTYTVLVASNDVGFNDTGAYTLTLAQTGAGFSITPGDEGGSLVNGANHTGNIHVGDLDMWSFNAVAGDAIMLAVGEVGNDPAFTPWIRLKSPTGQNLGSQSGPLAAQIEAVASVTGTYTVVVSTFDTGFDATGSYTLTLAEAPGSISISPGDQGGPMTNGNNHTGFVDVGDLDVWTFTANAGDAIMLAIGEVGADSAFVPWIRLKSPTGQNLGSQSGTLAAQIEAVAGVTGTYTVVVSTFDTSFDATGNYTLTLAVSGGGFTISSGDEGGAATNGANHTGVVHVGDLDMWSFTATAGDAIAVAIGEVGPDTAFVPWIRLKSPTGQNLGSQSGTLAAQIEAVAGVTGTYTIVVSTFDTGFDATGSYTLTLGKTGGTVTISSGDEGGPMINGSNHTGAVHVGDLDMWTFSATAGDAIVLGLGEVGADSAFTPWIRLKSPTGQNLGSQSGGLATQIEAFASVTGTYTVIVSTFDTGLDATGNYTLTLARSGAAYTISPGDEGGPLTNGANHTGAIHVGDLDLWSFTANAGDALTVAIGEVGGDSLYTPWIRLKSPTGQNLGSVSGTQATQINATASVTGTYIVVVSTFDTGLDATGNYTLTIANSPQSFVNSPGDEGGNLASNGAQAQGTIFIGDVDMWTFLAHEGDPLTVTIAEIGTGVDFTPWIRLRTPSGGNIGSQSGVTGATIGATAPETGIYTVVVGTFDTGLDGSGAYVMNVAGMSTNMIKNGQFDQGETFWQFFATPTNAYVAHQVTNGVLEYYRVPPPPGTSNSAVAFQETGVTLPAFAPVTAKFDLANTSPVRKRIAVLVLDSNFSDLSVCTFWLGPNAPMRTYEMRTHTLQAWANAALYFYAATEGSNGGVYQIDNVSMAFVPDQEADRTDCVDPTTPAAVPVADGPNLIQNGDFETGTLTPWSTFSFITWQINNGVFEFMKPSNQNPSGVVFQATGQAIPAGQILTATFELGNSSAVRKRVTAILNDADFSDLSACTFWLPPGQALSTYVYRTFTTKSWANAMVSIYPATFGVEQWIRLDNVTLQATPSSTVVGTECLEPSATSINLAGTAARAPVIDTSAGAQAAPAAAGFGGGAASTAVPDTNSLIEIIATAPGVHIVSTAEPIDLREGGSASLTFESLFTGANARALVQISVDGKTWQTYHEVAADDGWKRMDVDLSALVGETVLVRFVLIAREPSDETDAAWRLRNVRIVR